ncbi:hypothetical protein F2Q68_00016000 [Brassica cretica]|uniref:Uncharacterized protein n=1 Tax=Brassica cretica TaxID=69181 RepID=A0A8S9HND2_BRACR|nr:hypothetical protein F2Q68_00016000 [Brassica cretica]
MNLKLDGMRAGMSWNASWNGRVLRRELSPSYRFANGSYTCPGCKRRMDGAEAEFV